MHRRRLALTLILLLCGLVSAAPAQADGVTMQVEAHFAGHFKFGEWLPLRVSLANDGPALQAEVWADTSEAGGQTAYVVPVELPAGARKRLTLYVRPPSFARALRVRLLTAPAEPGDGEGRVLASRTVEVTTERNTHYLVGVLAPRRQAFSLLAGLTLNDTDGAEMLKGSSQYARPVKVIPLSLADIPERAEGLRLLDALVISGQDTSDLSPEQGQALQTWVEGGGRLVLGGGATAALTISGLPAALVQGIAPSPDPAEVDTAALSALGDYAGEPVRTPGPFVVAWPSGGQPLVEQGGRPLLVEQRLGKGRVNYAALDLAAGPFDAWAGTAGFWEKLLTPGSEYPPGAPPDVSPELARANSMSYVLQNLPALALPSIGWLAGLLGFYILLAGPISYLVLRRLRRLAWAWLTIPALTILFSIGAFFFAYQVRGGDVIINKLSLIDLSNAQRSMETYVGIFSPARRAYTLTFPGQALVSPLAIESDPWSSGGALASAGAEIVEGEPARVRAVQVNQWAMQGFRVESPVPPGWEITADVQVDGDRIQGTLTNRMDGPLTDAILVFGSRFLRLGELPPGEPVTINETLDAGANPNQQPFPYNILESMSLEAQSGRLSRTLQTRQQLLSNYFQTWGGPAQPPADLTLIAWLQSSPLPVQVEGVRWNTQQTGMVIAPLPVRYAAGPIHLAPGDLIARVMTGQGDVGICGPANQVYLAAGQATLEYSLPEALRDMKVSRLALVIQGGTSGMPIPTLEVAGPSGQWVTISSPKMGSNELSEPARFIAGGVLRLRLSSEAADAMRGAQCLTYSLDVVGELPADAGEQ